MGLCDQAGRLSIRTCEGPPQSLLGRYVAAGAYVDCYVTEVPFAVTHAEFVRAFYTTPLFKLERFLLSLFLARPSTDEQAKLLAEGSVSSFAAWSVESRAENQIVLAAGRTRSWLMVTQGSSGAQNSTRLYFGSAVVPRRSSRGDASMGPLITALLGFHKVYSRALLGAARSSLVRERVDS